VAGSNDWEQVELVFPSSLDFLSLVNAVAEEVAERLGVDRETRDSIGSSVIEACTNAIEHGNHERREKPVRLSFR
jgi:anti-sigma regulatory factor (Ser/Thr protein kinase)